MFLENGTSEENMVITRVARLQPSVENVEKLAKDGLNFSTGLPRNGPDFVGLL